MNQFYRFCVLLTALLTASCANIQTPKNIIATTSSNFTIPPVGLRSTAAVGETLISQGTIYETEAIKLNAAYRTEWINNAGIRGFPFVFDSGATLNRIATMNDVPIYSGPSRGGLLAVGGNQLGAPYGIGVSEIGEVKYVYVSGGIIPETPGRTVLFEKTKLVTVNKNNFKQEFLYNGRNDREIFFTYREFSGNLARPAFRQEVRYVLDDSNIIGFKSLKLHIEKATNQGITYSIKNAFK